MSFSRSLVPFLSPKKTLRESAANRAVTVNSLFVLLHGERREGSLYLIDWKIYISFGCWTKVEWIRAGRLVNGDLTKWKEKKDSLYFLTHAYTHIISAQTHTHTHTHRWAPLTVHTPSWILKHSRAHGHVTPPRCLRHTTSSEQKIYGRPVDCVNQIILKSIILVWGWFTECTSVCVCKCAVNIVNPCTHVLDCFFVHVFDFNLNNLELAV